jgi:hypothetical protein
VAGPNSECVLPRPGSILGGVAGDKAADRAMGGPNDINPCPRCAVRRCRSDGSDTATQHCFGSSGWSFGYTAIMGVGIRGLICGVRKQDQPLARGWQAAVTVLAGLARTGRRLDRRRDGQEKRRWRCTYGTVGSATAGTGRGIPPRTRLLGSRPVTGAGRAGAHQQGCRPDRAHWTEHAWPAW